MLVPTRNRQRYLLNILESYAGTGLQLIIADTSAAPLPGVENFPDARYHHFTECRFIDKLRFLVESATTEYIVLRAENRHITLNGITRCLDRLAQNPDYALVHGAHVWVRQKRGRIEAWPCYNADGLAGLMQERPEDRLLAAFDPMVSLYYAVERRENLLDVLAQAEGIENLNAFEVLLTAIKAINGKCAREPVLFCAVQERQSALKKSRMYDGFDKVATLPEYAQEHERVVMGIARHLALRSGLEPAQAEAVTRESLRRFLARQAPDRRETGAERLLRKAGKAARSGLRLFGLPDARAERNMRAYLDSLEGDAQKDYANLLATIRRGYREGW
jgi:glycosyltransferase domain-containing protein